MKKNLKKNTGITLVALVVTIIVLIILATVSINLVFNQEGLINKATGAVQDYQMRANEEENVLANITGMIDLYTSGNGGDSEETPKRTTLQVGDTVSYNPSGTYNWDASYATSYETGSTDYTNANQTLSSASGQSFNISSWKVLSINGSTVEMVPIAETSGTVRLQGAQGYNNAVKLLNDACSSLYSNSSKGITARSINVDDIEKIIINKGGYNPTTYTNGNAYYGSQIGIAYTGHKYYPTIYEQEKNRVINGSKSSSGLGLSEQTSLISRTASSATNGYKQASTSLQPYQTHYNLNSTDFSNYLGEYKDIILPRGTSTKYWVASRCVDTSSSTCYFRVRYVGSGSLGSTNLFYTNGGMNHNSCAVFPVVSLSSELISGNEVDGFRVN